MSHTYAQNVVHVVFSTKERRKTISAQFRPKVWAYSAGVCKKQGIFVHTIGGTEDHALGGGVDPYFSSASLTVPLVMHAAMARRHPVSYEIRHEAWSASLARAAAEFWAGGSR